MLEVYVHIPPELRDDLPVLQAVRISIPDDAGTANVSPRAIRHIAEERRPDGRCRERWATRGSIEMPNWFSQVPSILIPEETNLILNPAHPRMREVEIVSTRAFHFDPRLVGHTD